MARPPAAKAGQKQKLYMVRAGYRIAGNDNVSKYGGDTISLTSEQARHFQKQGVISVIIEDDDDEPQNDQTKTGAGDKAKGAGDALLGRTGSSTPA